MKKDLVLKRYPYCNISNTLIKEDVYKFNDIDEFINYIKQSSMDQDDKLFYGEYYICIEPTMSLDMIKEHIKGVMGKIHEYEKEGYKMNEVLRLYEVEFNTYTNSVKDCVYNKKKDKYLSIMDTVIIKETDIMEAMDYGNGIKTLKYVGELRKL